LLFETSSQVPFKAVSQPLSFLQEANERQTRDNINKCVFNVSNIDYEFKQIKVNVPKIFDLSD